MLRHVALAALVLCGCYTTRVYDRVMAPDGGEAFNVYCRHSRTACLRTAAQLCPQGYQILGLDVRNGPVFVQQTAYGANVYQSRRDEMLIECRRRATVTYATSNDAAGQ